MTEMRPFSRTPRKSSRDSSNPHAFRSRTVSVASTGSSDSSGKHNSLYKTELCRSYEETGNCRYGKKCQFAHSLKEIRVLNRHPKYKTEMCKSFHTNGYCPYGARCHFIHNPEDELLGSEYQGGANSSNSSTSGANSDELAIDKSLGALSLKVEEWPLPGNEVASSGSCSSSDQLIHSISSSTSATSISTNTWSTRIAKMAKESSMVPPPSSSSKYPEPAFDSQFVERSSPPTPWTSAMYSPKRPFGSSCQFGSIGSGVSSDRECSSSPEVDPKFDTAYEPFAPVEPVPRLELPKFEPPISSSYSFNNQELNNSSSNSSNCSWFFESEPDGIFQAPRLPVFQSLHDF